MDENPIQAGYLIASYYNKNDGVFYEYYEDLSIIDKLSDEEYESYTNDNTYPILFGPMTKQEFDTPDPMGWLLEDYLILNTPNLGNL